MKRKNADERKKEILSIAGEIIYSEGPAQFTMRKLAREIGITEAGIYRHFESKKNLYIALIDNLFFPWTEEMKKLDSLSHDAIQKLNKVADIHLNFLLNEKLNPILFISESMNPGNNEIADKLSQRLKFFLETIKKIILQGIKEGIFNKQLDIDDASLCVISLMQSAAIQLNIIGNKKEIKKRMLRSLKLLIKLLSVTEQ